ncbi:hypothetical protein TIFTF001_050916 [Ficus carica]|uniref:Uncharacterized protein n=1 Tax=Ficus carica TaxID=3494 RepID=A0AA88CJZ2_FICCA|nr:hypothetical protein TIFTF001_050916 [Ficus carica]
MAPHGRFFMLGEQGNLLMKACLGKLGYVIKMRALENKLLPGKRCMFDLKLPLQAVETLTYVLQQAGGNLQLYPEEKQHFVGHNERGKYNSAYSIGPLLPDVSILPAISDAILWKAGAADCEMWDGHCHSF